MWPNMPTRYDSSEAHEEQVKVPPEVVHSLPTLDSATVSLNLEAIIDISEYSLKLRLLRKIYGSNQFRELPSQRNTGNCCQEIQLSTRVS